MEKHKFTYEDAIAYLMERLPMFQRIGSSAYKKDLTNTIALLEAMGNPHHQYKTVHVGGTNGKGSVSHMIAAFLEDAGYKTGLYVSPHYLDIRERIKINGEYIDKDYFTSFVESHIVLIEDIQPSYFELLVAMAFTYFRDQEVDIAVIEVGLGGRLDSTNVITPILSVITNISYDHQNLLGDTLELIAGEKAGIIKSRVPVIIGERQENLIPIFEEKANELSATMTVASDLWEASIQVKNQHQSEIQLQDRRSGQNLSLELPLLGEYQLKNVVTAFAAAQILSVAMNIPDWIRHFEDAIPKLTSLWRFMGRMQVLHHRPLVIADSAHNEAGIRYLKKTVNEIDFLKLHIVFGAVNDKDLSKVFTELPTNATYYFSCPDIPRGLEAVSLQEQAATYGLKGRPYPTVKEAFLVAMESASLEDLILVAGSIFVVAEVLDISNFER
jgi:dihydrofolate synthase/folylpolyglutamate synthase